MAHEGRYVHLRPRLQKAASMLAGCDCLADIGCDHGRLGIAMLQAQQTRRVIATDISAPSLAKAKRLARLTAMDVHMEFRPGDGLAPLREGEANCIALCGMGGALMADILDRAPCALLEASKIVLQPMRGVSDIRRYLFTHGFRIVEDAVVPDAGRFYQVFSAVRGQESAPPDGWPEDCFLLGFHALYDPHMRALATQKLLRYEHNLRGAGGSRGEACLIARVGQVQQVLSLLGPN